jgi:predicted nucleic acid-binding protein
LSDLFRRLGVELVTPKSVKREVVNKGKRKGVADALVLDGLFKDNVFRVVEPKDERFLSVLLKIKGLHVTDAEVLTVARQFDGVAVIDDEAARRVARVYGVSYVGTPFLLMVAVRNGLMTKDEAKDALDKMIFAGWRCSIETYVKLVKAIMKQK